MQPARRPASHQKKKSQALWLYRDGWTLTEISEELSLAISCLQRWRDDEGWNSKAPPENPEIAIARRINLLAEKDNKTLTEIDEFQRLSTVFSQFGLDKAKAEKTLAEARKIDAEAIAIKKGQVQFVVSNQPPAGRGPYNKDPNKAKNRPVKNDISSITEEMIMTVMHQIFWAYQLLWWEKKNDPITRRNRFILKSRQIGATFYFAFEALADAILTGDNQLFLSASRDQAEVFKAYIIAFAQKYFGIELKGTGVITLSNGAELRFLSTNSNTAQSYHGHLYIDEVFWIPNYKRLNKISSGMAAHKKWRRTKFSTPSAISHEAYIEWSGEIYNKKLPKEKRQDFNVSHESLKNGWLGPDKIWRHMVTVEDAEQQGCDLFDIDELRLEYSTDDFNNLFMCQFIDDSQSVFNLAKLMACCVYDDGWKDYQKQQNRPYGNRPVALGYDPSRTRDNASLAIMAVPIVPKEPWRLLTKKSYHGQNFQFQANRIKEVKDTHNVVHIGIDTTGIGHGVFELVEEWFPLATPIHYSLDMKTQLVMKMLDLIENGRFKYLASESEVTRAFLMITKTTTGSGLITYSSSRSTETGHADIAWSIMHAVIYEPLNNNRRKTTVTFSEAA